MAAAVADVRTASVRRSCVQKSELRQLLSVRVVRDGDDWQLVGQLYDAVMADFAAEVGVELCRL